MCPLLKFCSDQRIWSMYQRDQPWLIARSDRYKCSILPTIKHFWNPRCFCFLIMPTSRNWYQSWKPDIVPLYHILYNTKSRWGWVFFSWFPLSQNWVIFSPPLNFIAPFHLSNARSIFFHSIYAYVQHVFWSLCMPFSQCWFLATSWTNPCSFIGKFHNFITFFLRLRKSDFPRLNNWLYFSVGD